MVAGHAEHGDDPEVVLDRGEHEPVGAARHRADEHHPLGRPQVVGDPHETARVGDVGLDPLLGRWRVTQLGQPGRRPARAAHRVDDEIGGEKLGVPGAMGEVHTRHPVAGGVRAHGLAAVDDLDVRDRGQPRPYPALQQRAAQLDGVPGVDAAELVAGQDDPRVERQVRPEPTLGDEVVHEPGEQRVEHLSATQENRVEVMSLWDTAPVPLAGGELVALDHGHLVVPVRQDPGGEHARHAPAEHHRLPAHDAHSDSSTGPERRTCPPSIACPLMFPTPPGQPALERRACPPSSHQAPPPACSRSQPGIFPGAPASPRLPEAAVNPAQQHSRRFLPRFLAVGSM
jgi:hypothetical protein